MSTVSIRIGEETHESLRRYRDNLQVAVNGNAKKYGHLGLAYPISLDDALRYLLLQQKGHTRRGKGFDPGGREKDKLEQEDDDERDYERLVNEGLGEDDA